MATAPKGRMIGFNICTKSPNSFRAKRGIPSRLLDHLVSAREQGGWRLEAERLGSLEVDHEIEPRGLFDRQVAGICAVQDLLHEISRSRVELALGWAVACQAGEPRIFGN